MATSLISIFEADSSVRIERGPLRGDRKTHSTPSVKVMKMTQFRLPDFGLCVVSQVHVWPRNASDSERRASRLNFAC